MKIGAGMTKKDKKPIYKQTLFKSNDRVIFGSSEKV
jgi:hypothetical protein